MASTRGTTAPVATDNADVSEAFDEATGADFIRIPDVDGRAMVVWPMEQGRDTGADGKTYTYIQAEVIVLDGEPAEKFSPMELFEMRFTTNSIVGQLRKNLTNGRPRLGRVSSVASKYRTRAYSLDPVEKDDPCRALLAEALKVREAAKAAEAAAMVDEDPFAS
jgi:hypothetical protein